LCEVSGVYEVIRVKKHENVFMWFQNVWWAYTWENLLRIGPNMHFGQRWLVCNR